MLIQTTTGNETFSAPPATFQVNCLYEPPEGQTHAAMPVTTAVRDPNAAIRSIGVPEYIPASNRSARHGQWTIGRYDVPEHAILRIELQRRTSGNIIYDYKKLYIRLRQDAALRQLRIPLSGHEHSTMVCCYYEGRFDIVRPDWFESLKLKPLRPEQYDQSDLSDWLTDIITEPEISVFRPVQTATVKTTSGRTVSLPVRTGGRKLTLKPRK